MQDATQTTLRVLKYPGTHKTQPHYVLENTGSGTSVSVSDNLAYPQPNEPNRSGVLLECSGHAKQGPHWVYEAGMCVKTDGKYFKDLCRQCFNDLHGVAGRALCKQRRDPTAMYRQCSGVFFANPPVGEHYVRVENLVYDDFTYRCTSCLSTAGTLRAGFKSSPA